MAGKKTLPYMLLVILLVAGAEGQLIEPKLKLMTES